MLYEEWKSRYKNLKNFNTVLQRCPRFWPLAPPRGMNPGVYSLGISEDPPRYLSSKFDASVRSDCWDISIWKTLTQCDGNGNANANDRGDYNSSPCTLYRRAKNDINLLSAELVQSGEGQGNNADPARCTQIRLPSLFAIQKIIATDYCQIVQFLEQQ